MTTETKFHLDVILSISLVVAGLCFGSLIPVGFGVLCAAEAVKLARKL